MSIKITTECEHCGAEGITEVISSGKDTGNTHIHCYWCGEELSEANE